MDSLNEQIDTIQTTFQEIKEAIIEKGVEVDDCDSPTVYPAKIREIQGSGGGTIITDVPTRLTVMAFRSSEEAPSAPTGGSWNVEEETITPPTDPKTGEAWSFGSESLSGNVYASQAIFNNDNTLYMEWTTPFKVTGNRGLPGKDGAPGAKGDPGDVRVVERIIPIYKSSDTKPSTPTGGYFNFDTEEFTAPSGWSKTEPTSGIIWMSWGTFSIEAPNSPSWGTPIRLTGENGKNGTDGTSIEFIFKLTATSLQTPAAPTNSSQIGYVPDGWTNHPIGISSEMQCEWVCSRTLTEGNWTDWSIPAIWAKWGENGTDGDGIEYIYYLSSDGTSPGNPTPEDYETNTEYQKNDWFPTGSNWSDDPHGVSSENTCEFVSKRKYIGETKKWGAFTDPVLWSKYSEDGLRGPSGISIREMYASFDSEPPYETTNINPGSAWSLTINNPDNKTVWAIQAYVDYTGNFATTEDYPNLPYYGWCKPFIKIGKNGKDGTPVNWVKTVYTLSASKPNAPEVGVDPENPGSSLNASGETVNWIALPNQNSNFWWHCHGTVNGSTGLVTEWSTPCPDSGKDGTAQDGRTTEARYAISNSFSTHPTISRTTRYPDGWYLTSDSEYTNLVNAVLTQGKYLFRTEASINPDNTLNGAWCIPVPINGEKGQMGEQGLQGPAGADGVTRYFHLKFADDANGLNMRESPAGDWLGTYIDEIAEDSIDPNDYVWQEVRGAQGPKGENGINGKDGVNGITGHLHIAYANSADGSVDFSTLDSENREYLGWYIDYVNAGTNPDDCVDSTDYRDYKWVRIKGERGETGPVGPPGGVGPQGASGIPGSSIEVRYCLGTDEFYNGSDEWENENVQNPSGWTVTVPNITEGFKYIWCIQGIKSFTSPDNNSGIITWQKPFRLSGINGLPGSPGRKGQIIYPAGIYDSTKVYVCDNNSAPYVYDPNGSAYYVLNKDRFDGPANYPTTPATSSAWVKFEMLDAVFAKVGVISNGLIGSAVFNGDYMFSQQGISSVDNVDNQGANKGFGGFNPSECEGDNFDGLTTFKPNLLFNYKTGAAYLAKGNIQFFGDGSGKIGDFLSWDKNGAITNLKNKTYIINKTKTTDDVVIPDKSADIYIVNGLDHNTSDLLYWKNIAITFGWRDYASLTEEEKRQEIFGSYNIYNLTAIPLLVEMYSSGEGEYGTFVFPISYYVDGTFNRTIKSFQAFVSPGGCLSLTAVNTTAVSTKWIYDTFQGEEIMFLATKNVTPYFNYRNYGGSISKEITAISNNGTSIKAWEKITFPTSHPYNPSKVQEHPINGYLGICSIKPGSIDGILIIPDADDITHRDNPANVKYTVKVWNSGYTDDYYRPLYNKFTNGSFAYMGSPLLSMDFIADVGSDQLYLDLSSLETNVKYNWDVNITNIGPATKQISLFDSGVAFKVYFYKDGQIVGEYHTGLIRI